MFTLTFGPLVLSGAQLAIGVSMAVAAIAGRSVAGGKNRGIGPVLLDMALAAFVAGRIVFVVLWFELYRSAPWSMLDVRDGGYTPWAGWLAAFLVAAWKARRHPLLRTPLTVGLAAGAVAWIAMNGVLQLLERPMMPEAAVTTLDGEPVALSRLAAGRPLVVNLWATWCPPCRREMPVLAAAQQREKGIAVVFVNQGEDAVTVHRYLTGAQLALGNVVLDRPGNIARAVGSSALPTTLFYDASGRLVDTHLGELSAASLAARLKALPASPAASGGR